MSSLTHVVASPGEYPSDHVAEASQNHLSGRDSRDGAEDSLNGGQEQQGESDWFHFGVREVGGAPM